MEGKNAQESAEKSKVFQIPIKYFENSIDIGPSKEKKKEIIELITTHNKLRSVEEFDEVRYYLYDACKEGDLEKIKILLSETVEDSTHTLKFKIDETNQTASLYKVKNEVEEVNIPRTVKHESTEYLITSIIGTCDEIKTIKFCEDSSVKTFYKNAFYDTEIEEIYFPSSLKELKEGWCYGTRNLKRIIISPSNGQYEFKENKYLICKSDSNNNEFDKLLFVRRDIKEFSIPSNIKIISSYTFSDCKYLLKVEIPKNSNLQTIESNAFSFSKIKSIFIPSKVSKICEFAFAFCKNLEKVDIPTNSNLQTIESHAFYESNIESIFIPSNVSKIGDSAFSGCQNLLEVEIPTNSNLQTIESFAFAYSEIEEIYFPSSLKELKEGWCNGTEYLKRIIISPSNGQYKFKEDKYLVCKSDSNNDEFDKLLFVRRDIDEFSIPSNIKIISSYSFSFSNIKTIFIPSNVSKICEYAFSDCYNLLNVEIPTNSNLKAIESNTFTNSNINSIFIPSKVSKINEFAFLFCENLQIIEISEKSKLNLLQLSVFKIYRQVIIMIPSSLI